MTKYIALLRGITPSDPNMRNEKLRAAIGSLGYEHVTSVASSGNIIFDADTSEDVTNIEKSIETVLYTQLGISTVTIARTAEQIQALIEKKPFAGYEHSPETYLAVTFLKHTPMAKVKFLTAYDIVGIYEQDICSVMNTTARSQPDLLTWLEKNHGTEITTRTWGAVERILKKMSL